MKKLLSYLFGLVGLLLIVYLAILWASIQHRRNLYWMPETPSPTSYPALSHDEAWAQVIEYLQANAGCRLPCWWGISPGKTRWEAVHSLLSPLLETKAVTDKLLSYGGRRGISSLEDPALPGFQFRLKDSIVQDILVFSVRGSYLIGLDMFHLFQAYGKPDEIFLRVFSYTSNRLGQVFLYYPRLGMAIEYRYAIDGLNQPVRLCNLDQPLWADFYLWEHDPPAVEDFYMTARRALWHPTEYKILPLERATSWSIDSFYEIFQPPGVHPDCVETSADLWTTRYP